MSYVDREYLNSFIETKDSDFELQIETQTGSNSDTPQVDDC